MTLEFTEQDYYRREMHLAKLAQDKYEMTALHRGFTIADIRKQFNRLMGESDWRAAIFLTVPMEEISITLAAIEYFTATLGKVMQTPTSDGNYEIYSPSYRNGPAGDH